MRKEEHEMKKEYIEPEIKIFQFLLPDEIMNEYYSYKVGDNDNIVDDDEEESGESGAKPFDWDFSHDWDLGWEKDEE